MATRPLPPPQFRSSVDVVLVDVTVLNRSGHPLTDLRAEDFTLLVDGRPRAIQSVRLVTADGQRPPGASVPAEPRGTPMAALARALPSRFVIAVDRDHIPVGEGQPMLAAAARFVDTLPPDDRVAVWPIPGSSQTLRFPAGRDEVKREARLLVGTARVPLGRFMIGRQEALKVADNDREALASIVARECEGLEPVACRAEIEGQARQQADEERQRADRLFADLGRLIDALAAIDGPKHVVLITGGPLMECSGTSRESRTWPTARPPLA